MSIIGSYEELQTLYEEVSPLLDIRLDVNGQHNIPGVKASRRCVLVCSGTGCRSSESQELVAAFHAQVQEKGLADSVDISITGCFGFCELGPIVKIFPDDTFYVEVKPKDVREIVESHLQRGVEVSRLLYYDPAIGQKVRTQHEMSFYKKQQRVALRNCGLIHPERITDYIANKGYQALGMVLTTMTPEDVIGIITQSGLRGRAGGGFSTGQKWAVTRNTPSDRKFIVCNADEGDPGAFMDRSILEGDPHSILEAMLIAGYAVGARKGYIYLRAEYPLAIERFEKALQQAQDMGLVGKNILGSGFDFEISVKYGAGAFVCGEETALIHSIEGQRGEPTTKPPFPAQNGLWGCPTSVNNVETYANIPPIILNGAEWFRAIGTTTSPGTKVFALAGQIKNVGLVEVPMGTTLRKMIYDIGGGLRDGQQLKSVQIGGPAGGCLPVEHLDTRLDYESMKHIDAPLGSGGIIVLGQKDCMVNIAKFFLEFIVTESCGKCTPCRIGNKRLHEILTRITEGRGTDADLTELQELSEAITLSSLCGLGRSAPKPVLSTLKHFRVEYDAHVKEKRCPAGVCLALVTYTILPDRCTGCGACARVCPVDCIIGMEKKPHVIVQRTCTKCGICLEKCQFDAIVT